ncbi:MAG: HAMP domain-containing protein [Thermoplasmatales archaeon]|nr:HAMP domain-containing protein [Thermoplasmatales archaeon]
MMRLRALLIAMCLAISMIPVAIIGGFQGFQIATAFLGIIIVVTFFVSLFISYFITLPLEKLTKNIDEISKGNLDVKMEKSEIFEINNLTDSLNRVMTSLKLAIHKVGVKKGEIFEETVKEKQEMKSKYETVLKIIDEWVWEVDEKGIYNS